MKKICFYQFAHIGDLFLSLPFIESLIAQSKEYEFFHTTETESKKHFNEILLKIVSNLKIQSDRNCDFEIRTWQGHIKEDFFNNSIIPYEQFNDSFECFRFLWEKIFSDLNLSVKIDQNLEINYDHIGLLDKTSIKNIENFFNNNKDKKNILIFNQKPFSEQTDLEEWGSYINYIATKFSKINFIYTNKESLDISLENVFWSPSIFGNHSCDIIHNSYLSLFCDILVGRVSGPFMYSSMHSKNCSDIGKIIISQHGPTPNDYVCFFNKKVVNCKNFITRTSSQTFLELENLL